MTNPTSLSSVEVLAPKPKIVFKFNNSKPITKENPGDENPVACKDDSSTTDNGFKKQGPQISGNSKSQVETETVLSRKKRNVSPEAAAEKSKSKKRRMTISLELSEERIIADVLAMSEGKPSRIPKEKLPSKKSTVDMIHNHFTPGARFSSRKEFHPHSFPQFLETVLRGDD